MQKNHLVPAVLMMLLSLPTVVLGQATPATQSATVDLASTEELDLWPVGTLQDQPAQNTETYEQGGLFHGYPDRRVSNVSHPTIRRFPLPKADRPSAAVIIMPGGGYGTEVYDREGNVPADRLRAAGIAPFVLKYRLPHAMAPAAGELPTPIQDVQRAVRLVRAHASEWNIDPHRVGVMGFSAGGHVAGTAATHFDAGDANPGDPVARESCRPDFAVLMYAVSSMHPELTHAGSRRALLGEHASRELEDQFSTAQRVTPQTPPLFLVHAKDDDVVKFQNSVEVADAAKRAGVPCEFVIYQTGGHGFGIAPDPKSEPHGWIDRCIAWIKQPKRAAPSLSR